jgi:hypothetical protein
MTDSGVYTSHYFIKRLGRDQTEPLDLDFSYHLEPHDCAFQFGKNVIPTEGEGAPVTRKGWSDRTSPQLLM